MEFWFRDSASSLEQCIRIISEMRNTGVPRSSKKEIQCQDDLIFAKSEIILLLYNTNCRQAELNQRDSWQWLRVRDTQATVETPKVPRDRKTREEQFLFSKNIGHRLKMKNAPRLMKSHIIITIIKRKVF